MGRWTVATLLTLGRDALEEVLRTEMVTYDGVAKELRTWKMRIDEKIGQATRAGTTRVRLARALVFLDYLDKANPDCLIKNEELH